MSNNPAKELTISRLIKAPRELVFRMWTEPEHIKNWWGPEGFTSTIYEMDVRPGGNWEFTMHGPDGTDYRNQSKYIEIDEPSRIVFDHMSAPKFRMTVTFADEGSDTLVSITSVFESNEQLQQVIKVFRADEGLKQNMDRLSAYLQSDMRSAGDFVIERLFNAPVDKVWSAITNRDEMAQWYFDLAEFRPEVGFEFRFAGGPEDRSYLHICEITEVVPERKLTYSWRYDGYEGMSFVTFELTPDGSKTRLRLTHSGLHTFPASNNDFARSNFQMGWKAIIGDSLKKYLEP